MKPLQSEQAIAKRVTLVGAIWDTVLGLAKILAGYLSQSQALMADGIHSLSDLVTDVFVYIAADNARQEPDEDHPYGHLRFETLTTVLLGIVLVLVAIGIALDAYFSEGTPTVTWYGLTAILATIAIKEAIFHYTRKAGEQIGSKMLVANAWHSRSDALSSVAVLVGMGGIYIGWPWADKVASVIVAILIGKIAIEMILENIAELVDTAPDKTILEQIKQTVNELPNVMQPHDLRARSMAGKIYLDMHIQVPSYISVSEGHYLSDTVIHKIKSQNKLVEDVLIHIDPDGALQPTDTPSHLLLPSREQIMADLPFLLKEHATYIEFEEIKLHYLIGGLELDLIAYSHALPEATDVKNVNAQILEALTTMTYCNHIRVYWRY